VIITTWRIRRTLVNKINLLVGSPRSIEASRLAPVKAESIFLRRASCCFGTSRGSSRGLSSTTSPRAGSSSTSSPTPHVRVPRHVARLVTRLVVDYFTYAARPVASARRAACRVTRRRLLHLATARRRLLRLRRASRCLGTSCGSSSTTSRVRVPRHVARLITRLVALLVIDYFTYAARPVASARRAACRVTHRRLLRLAQARRRLLHLRHASGCLGTSRGSSSTTSTTPCVRVPRHVARLITRLVAPLVVDYSAYVAASARRVARHPARRRLLRLAQARHQLLHLRHASGCLGMSRGSSLSSSRCSSSTTSPTPSV
jgi:hypothetical protein